ncbi:MAG: NADH-quinone oxidoreductase subunit NuoF [Candidatus Margulisbacteria bacterium]|nr:NADH-quinone oxidoreductase subunit NuoF [Candidatus Margulisiibacteriota bacterium]
MRPVTIKVGLGTCGISAGAKDVYDELERLLKTERSAILDYTSCNGMCFLEPIVEIYQPDKPVQVLTNVKKSDVPAILQGLKTDNFHSSETISEFSAVQKKLILGNCGLINPDRIEDYLERGGYEALRKIVKNNDPEDVIKIIKNSGLRGRGGAGFLTGVKWELAQKAKGKKKYVICNADEGDPGAFMNRAVLEGDPHRVIEGLIISGYAIGADRGYIYVRAEYPLAVQRIKNAILKAKDQHFLGENILGSKFSFELMIKEGAGAFVCGEETALMASIEGKRGMPKLRPPYPAQSGLWGCPTNINNVETLAAVPWIIRNGADEYAKLGKEKNRGTKVFSLAGKIKRSGLAEVELGTSLRKIIYEVGGGTISGEKVKAVQLGGPSGGCLPDRLLDTTVDYESLAATGAIMGSGGIIVMDNDTCIVDIARYFLNFTQQESCGKCTFCRIGTKRMLEILERITEGKSSIKELEKLKDLAEKITSASLCMLGKTAPNPVLTTLKYFEDEYLEHIQDKKCRAGVCKALIKFEIKADKCTGCTLCAKNCPVKAISGQRKQPHFIDQSLCTKCGVCADVCGFGAVEKK